MHIVRSFRGSSPLCGGQKPWPIRRDFEGAAVSTPFEASRVPCRTFRWMKLDKSEWGCLDLPLAVLLRGA